MLACFDVKNYRSFASLQELCVAKLDGDEQLTGNTFRIPKENIELLKTVAIYGANASGKTNLLRALEDMAEVVVRGVLHNKPLPVMPFKLDVQYVNDPTEFEVVFIADHVRYQYGFSATTEQVFEEWLFAYPKGRAQKWFERTWNPQKEDYDWTFGQYLVGGKKAWQQATRKNALFLSTAVQLNSQQLKPLVDWFSTQLKIVGTRGFMPVFTVSQCLDERKKSKYVEFLKNCDLSIDDIHVIFKETNLPKDFIEEDQPVVQKSVQKGCKIERVDSIHKDNQGNAVAFDFFKDESQGTRQFFSYIGPILDILENGYVLCVDELNTHMHPKLVEFIIGLFHSPKTNPNNAQLIFTTHETSVLRSDLFRRDQIWFCEKQKDQSTKLYSLSDFKPEDEKFETYYLSGRYGAIPYLSESF